MVLGRFSALFVNSPAGGGAATTARRGSEGRSIGNDIDSGRGTRS
ncbi:MAG: hypothetical protein ACLFNZ_07705 [Spirochaetaceae bacterium]